MPSPSFGLYSFIFQTHMWVGENSTVSAIWSGVGHNYNSFGFLFSFVFSDQTREIIIHRSDIIPIKIKKLNHTG